MPKKNHSYRGPSSRAVCLVTLCLGVLSYLKVFSKALGLVGVVLVDDDQQQRDAIQFSFIASETASKEDGDSRSSITAVNATSHHSSSLSSSWAFHSQGLPPTLSETVLDDLEPMRSCGVFKCFFPSKSDMSMGWLVMPARRYFRSVQRSASTYPLAQRAWEFAMTRQASFSSSTHGGRFRHFYHASSPPFVTGRLSAHTTANLWKPKFNKTLCPPSDCRLTVKSPTGFTVQRLHRAPASALLVKLHVAEDERSRYTWHMTPSWEDFWEEAHRRTNLNHAAFVQNFLADLEVTLQLIQEVPAFKVDFQCIITAEGFIYHLDLDRLFETVLLEAGWRHKWDPHVLPALQELRQKVVTQQVF